MSVDLPACFAALAPLPLQRQRAEHDRLRGALRARARRLPRRVEQVGDHADAALLDLRRLRVLGVIDVVAMEVFGDQALGLRLHPGRHERGEVAHRDAVEHQVLADQPHRVDGRHAVLGQLVVGRAVAQDARPVAIRMRAGHRRSSSCVGPRQHPALRSAGPSSHRGDRTAQRRDPASAPPAAPSAPRLVLLGDERPERAGEEARGAERGVPVAGREVQHGAGRRHDVPGHSGDPEEDAAEQVHRRLPPAPPAARGDPAAARRGGVGDRPGDQEADRAERVGAPDEPVVGRFADRGFKRPEGGDVEEQRARRLHDRGAPRRGPRRVPASPRPARSSSAARRRA